MVSRWVLAACLLSAPAAAALRAEIDAPVVALGEPLTLTLTAPDGALDALDLTPLVRQFQIGGRTLNRGPGGDTLTLTLYARAAGAVELPALSAGSARSQPLRVTIRDGSDSVPRVALGWTLASARPWVNEPVRLSLAVCDDGSLQWRRPTLPVASGRLIEPRGETVADGVHDGLACTVHRFDWSLTATRPGRFVFDAPMVAATRFGQPLRFPAPDLKFEARALPPWLPADVPPVAPRVVQQPLPHTGAIGRPVRWRFAVTGGYAGQALETLIETQLRETEAYRFYSVELTPAMPDDPDSPLTRFDVTLHVEPLRRGALELPVLVLPWYDAGTGRLESVAVRAAQMRIVDPRLRLAGGLASLAAGGLLLFLVGRHALRAWRWRRRRRAGLDDVARATSLEALGAAVRRFSLTREAEAPSLGAWLRAHCADGADGADGGPSEIAALVAQLERAQFAAPPEPVSEAAARADADLPALRRAFVAALARLRPGHCAARSLAGERRA